MKPEVSAFLPWAISAAVNLPEKTRENIRTALRRDTREGFLHELAGKGIVPVLWENGAGVIYGVTTGYGDSCVVAVPLQHVEALPRHLYTFHGCGLGKLLDAQATRAVLAARSLTAGSLHLPAAGDL